MTGMFQRVCIANRGEIAVRVMRTCRTLGIATHALYSDADAGALHVRSADGATRIGAAPVAESYLNAEAVLDAAVAARCDAVHPGYGLLSENPAFARACAQRGLTFIGPDPLHIEQMGDKDRARALMRALGIRPIPGSAAILPDDDVDGIAAQVGYPLIVKASRGGGGIGMAVAREPDQLARALRRARSTASRAFGSQEIYLERQILGAHHVEVQLLGDGEGAALHLGERECSVQRRHQKVIEETPAPSISASLRRDLLNRAVAAMEQIRYRNAGTVECLVTPEDVFYFLEMNTRLQVEHPVTEMVTGLDLVAWQLRLAAGEPLRLPPHAATPNGHAIEARIYAEHPQTLLPAPGRAGDVRFPSGDGIRVDAAIESGDEVSPYYDPLIAKLVVWGGDRDTAVQRLTEALAAVEIDGVTHNLPLLQRIVAAPAFVAGNYDVYFLESLLG